MDLAAERPMPVRFAEQKRALVSLRLTAQAKQALEIAYTKGLPCSLRFSPDGSGAQVLTIGGEEFPFQAHEHDQTTELLRIRGAGSAGASATEVGTVSHKLQLQPRMDDAQRKRTRERGEEAERDRKERKLMRLGEKSEKSGAKTIAGPRKTTPVPSTRPTGKPSLPAKPIARATPPPRQGTPPARAATPPIRLPTPTPSQPQPTLPARTTTPTLVVNQTKKVADFLKGSKDKRKTPTPSGNLKAPAEALQGAKTGGLRLCLIGLLCRDARWKLQQIEQMLADVLKQVPEMRKPSKEGLLAALKEVAKHKAPGFWMLDDVIGQLKREAQELTDAVSSRTAGSTESSGTTAEQTASVSRTASAEDPDAQARRSPSPSPAPHSIDKHKPLDTPNKRKAQSVPPHALKAHPPRHDGPMQRAYTPPASPSPRSPSREMHIRAAQGQTQEVFLGPLPQEQGVERRREGTAPATVGKRAPTAEKQGSERRKEGSAPSQSVEMGTGVHVRTPNPERKKETGVSSPTADKVPQANGVGKGARMPRPGSSPPVLASAKRQRMVLDESEEESDGLGGAPEPLQRAQASPVDPPRPQPQPAPRPTSAPVKPSRNGLPPLAGTPSMSSSWEPAASDTTWFEEHLSRQPDLAPPRPVDHDAFQASKKSFNAKLETFNMLHRLRRKFDRQVKALTASKLRAIQSEDPALIQRWEKEVDSLFKSKGKHAEDWTKAYWVLHKELSALRIVLDAYWAACRG